MAAEDKIVVADAHDAHDAHGHLGHLNRTKCYKFDPERDHPPTESQTWMKHKAKERRRQRRGSRSKSNKRNKRRRNSKDKKKKKKSSKGGKESRRGSHTTTFGTSSRRNSTVEGAVQEHKESDEVVDVDAYLEQLSLAGAAVVPEKEVEQQHQPVKAVASGNEAATSVSSNTPHPPVEVLSVVVEAVDDDDSSNTDDTDDDDDDLPPLMVFGSSHHHVPASLGTPSGVEIDLEAMGLTPPTWDQLNSNSCVAHALDCLIGIAMKREHGRDWNNPSRRFLYYNARRYTQCTNRDGGVSLTEGVRAFADDGECSDQTYPFSDRLSDITTMPPPSAYTEAHLYKDLDARAIWKVPQTKQAIVGWLQRGAGVACGMELIAAYESEKVAHSGVSPAPGPHDQGVGGHAQAIIGASDSRQMFKVRNSWGSRWGVKGSCWVPYDYILNPDWTADFVTIYSVSCPAPIRDTSTTTTGDVHVHGDCIIDGDQYA